MSDPKQWNLWKVLKRRRITIGDLAEMTSYSRVHLQRVKAGTRGASKGLRASIALALNMPVDFLFSQED